MILTNDAFLVKDRIATVKASLGPTVVIKRITKKTIIETTTHQGKMEQKGKKEKKEKKAKENKKK